MTFIKIPAIKEQRYFTDKRAGRKSRTLCYLLNFARGEGGKPCTANFPVNDPLSIVALYDAQRGGIVVR